MRSSLYKFLTKKAGQVAPAPIRDSAGRPRNLINTSKITPNSSTGGTNRSRNLVRTSSNNPNAIVDRSGRARNLVQTSDIPSSGIVDRTGRSRRFVTTPNNLSNGVADSTGRIRNITSTKGYPNEEGSVTDSLGRNRRLTDRLVYSNRLSEEEANRLIAQVEQDLAKIPQPTEPQTLTTAPKATQPVADPSAASQWESIRSGLASKPQHEQLQELGLLANDPTVSDAVKAHIANYVQGSSGNAQPSLPTEARANVPGNLNRLGEAANALRADQQQQLRDNTTTLGSNIIGGLPVSAPSVVGPIEFADLNTDLSPSTQAETSTKPVNPALAINQTHALNIGGTPANLTMQHTSSDTPRALEGVQFDNYNLEVPDPIKSNVPEKAKVTNQQTASSSEQPKVQSNNIVFRNGHAVKFDPSKVDWTTPDGPTPNNVGGTWYTDDQYAAFDNIRGQLYSSYTSQGMNSQKARDLATRRAKQYVGDQMQMARGGTAFNKWKDQPAPEIAPAPTVAQAPTATPAPAVVQAPEVAPAPAVVQAPMATQAPAVEDIPGQPNYATTKKPKVVNSSPHEGKIAPLSAMPKKAPKAVANKNKFADKTWTQQEILGELKNRRNSVAKGLIPVKGREGLYYKDGDASQTIVDRLGRPMTYKGQVINDALLRNDTGWGWLLGMDSYGNEILHNAEQYAQREASRNFNDELAALGFKPVPGNKRWYVNDKGQYVDISGELAPTGTLASQLDTNRTVGQRWQKDNYDPWGWFISGDMDDIGIQR